MTHREWKDAVQQLADRVWAIVEPTDPAVWLTTLAYLLSVNLEAAAAFSPWQGGDDPDTFAQLGADLRTFVEEVEQMIAHREQLAAPPRMH